MRVRCFQYLSLMFVAPVVDNLPVHSHLLDITCRVTSRSDALSLPWFVLVSMAVVFFLSATYCLLVCSLCCIDFQEERISKLSSIFLLSSLAFLCICASCNTTSVRQSSPMSVSSASSPRLFTFETEAFGAKNLHSPRVVHDFPIFGSVDEHRTPEQILQHRP